MINSCYKISLDIQDHSSNVLLKAKKGDTGRTLFITLTDGRNPYTISEECRAVFTAKKADGKTLFNECSIIDHVIVYEFTPQTTSVAGKAACEIKLYGADEKLLTSAHFTLMVDDTVYNEGDEVESAQEVTALTALMSKTIELIESVSTISSRLEKIDGIVTGLPFEPGYAYPEDNVLKYFDSPQHIRTPEGAVIHLNKGDYIECRDSLTYDVFAIYKVDGEYVAEQAVEKTEGEKETERYTATVDGDYVISIYHDTALVDGDLERIASNISIVRNSGCLAKEVVRFTEQDLTPSEQAQARANIGVFTYNFTIVNEESYNPADAKAIDHIVHNWQKQPMDIYVQGYPVIGLDKDNRHMMVLYHDRYISTLTWEVDISTGISKLYAVSRRQLADTAYVDKMLGKIILNGDTLTWDGNREGRAVVEWTTFGSPYYAVHISDVVLGFDDISDGGSAFVTYVGTDGNSSTVEIAKTDFGDIGFGLITFGDVISVPSNWVGQEVDGWGDGAVTFPKAGLYFSGGGPDGEVRSVTVTSDTLFFAREMIKPTLLPDSVATKEYVDAAIGSAITASY